MVSQRGDADHSIWQLAFVVVVDVIIGRTDDAGSCVTQIVSWHLPMELFAIVVEHDGAIKTEFLRHPIQNRNGFDKRKLASFGHFDFGDIVAHPHRFDVASGRQNPVALQFGPIVQNDASGLTVFDVDFGDTTAQFQFSAQPTEFANEVFQDHADAFEWTPEAFQIAGPKHDAKLAVIHVVLACVAVPHQWTQQHFDQ